MGPGALRYAGLHKQLRNLGYRVEDYGNIQTTVRTTVAGHKNLVDPIRDACEALYQTVRNAVETHRIPLVMGGDHSLAIGTVGGTTHYQKAGILWIDAHADFNTFDSSPTGNIHGMPLAILCGKGPPGVGTPVPGGLNPREAHLIMELIAEDGRLASASVVEINPILDERNRTAILAAQLIASLFGKTIL